MSQRRVLPFCNPATGERFGEVLMANAADIAQAHVELHRNFPIWRAKPPKERARVLRKFLQVLIEYADEIAAVVNQDTGKSRQDALTEVFLLVDRLSSYIKHSPRWLRPERIPAGIYIFKRYYAEPQPYGVVAVLGPWNLPLELSISPVFSALLAGNTVMLKPSDVTAATGVMVEKLFQSVPELSPFVRVLHGDAEVGAAVVQSGPDLIFLTGAVSTGRKVARAAAETLTPVLFELGGKDPMIVLEDADIRAAAHWGAWGTYYHSGQACEAVERIYVIESVYEEFLAAFIEETQEVTLGYSPEINNPNVIGPLTFERQCQIIEEHIEDALAKGARIAYGGKRQGMYMQPTVLVDVDHSMRVMKEETFGPVAPIMKVKDQGEAIRLANDSVYGLSASVWSNDLERAEHVARQLEVGSVVVNDTLAHYAVPLLPFGGVKQSGTARTHGRQDVLQFTQTRSYGVGKKPFTMDIAAEVRKPNKYHLLSAIMHGLYGVTLRQRAQAIPDLAKQIAVSAPKAKPKPRRIVLGAGAAAALGAVAFALLRIGGKE